MTLDQFATRFATTAQTANSIAEARNSGNPYAVVATSAGVVASAAQTGALTTVFSNLSIATTAVPVVGAIAVGVTLIAGALAKAFAKKKAIKEARLNLQDQNKELRQVVSMLDQGIGESNRIMAAIYTEMKAQGLSGGLGILGIKKEEEGLDLAKKINATLNQLIEAKTKILETRLNELQSLFDKYTTSQRDQQIVFFAGLGLLVIGGLILIRD